VVDRLCYASGAQFPEELSWRRSARVACRPHAGSRASRRLPLAFERQGGEFVDILNSLFRWLHILAGIVWIGMLYFFNWVNGPFAATLDGETKKKVVPELMPRALFWFRWGAFWTVITGILLLLLVFYHGGIMFDGDAGWSAGAIVMAVVPLLAPIIYDTLQKSALGKDPKTFGAVAFVLVAVVVVLMVFWGGFSYRAYNIHMGALFGFTMVFNVWSRIWPAQQKIITAVKEGTAPDAALVSMAGTRSRHNTYMSVPLVWTMINQHTTAFAGGNFGLTRETSFVVLLLVILLGWHIVWHLYKRAAKVKGF
jgi:uncharacterized membrane protein